MARIRTIKPDFWTDEKLVELDFVDRLLFVGMWNFADDQGYLDYSPKRIKMQVFPGDNVDVSRGLARIHELGLIRLYDSPEGPVVHIVNWERHQRVSNPSRARFMQGDLQERDFEGGEVQSPLEDSVRKGREGKGSISCPAADAADETEDRFDEFWRHYPRKEAKQDARKAWKRITRKTDPQTVIDGLAAYAFNPDPQYRPLAASWLRGQRWEDEPPTLHAVPDRRLTSAELDDILGPDRETKPTPPADLDPDAQWEWQHQKQLERIEARQQQARERLAVGR